MQALHFWRKEHHGLAPPNCLRLPAPPPRPRRAWPPPEKPNRKCPYPRRSRGSGLKADGSWHQWQPLRFVRAPRRIGELQAQGTAGYRVAAASRDELTSRLGADGGL